MSSSYALKINPERAKEMPMVDLAFEVLKAANTPFYYRDLMMEIAKIKGLSEEEVMQVIAQIYTEINIDGRFACVGTNLWGLKRWYPVEKADDAMGNTKRPRIINDEDDDMDDDDLFGEEEDTYTADEESYDAIDEESEELFSDEDEVEEVEDDVVIEDADIEEEDTDDELDGLVGEEAADDDDDEADEEDEK